MYFPCFCKHYAFKHCVMLLHFVSAKEIVFTIRREMLKLCLSKILSVGLFHVAVLPSDAAHPLF